MKISQSVSSLIKRGVYYCADVVESPPFKNAVVNTGFNYLQFPWSSDFFSSVDDYLPSSSSFFLSSVNSSSLSSIILSYLSSSKFSTTHSSFPPLRFEELFMLSLHSDSYGRGSFLVENTALFFKFYSSGFWWLSYSHWFVLLSD